ncbi:MAG TPA: FAD-dependent oxidoreductase [Gemmataceae bacterium]|jgi:sarcosine oxidase subunit beta|nr:FAD-dependent oxidoreductase [Gemmataceae bacterium]
MPAERMWRTHDLKPSYDVVIVGAGVHGLGIAYYLGKRGIRNVAVLDKGYLGGGASGRNTAIIRSNYRTPQGVAFYDESLKLYERLAVELDYNVMFSQQGHLTVAHSERSVTTLRERAETNRLLGVDSRILGPKEIAQLVPGLEVSDRAHQPILAGLYHPPGGIIRHDAVVWGYARGADRQGIEIHPFTEVTAVHRQNGRITGVATNRGAVATPLVVNATAGWCSTLAHMAGVELPIVTHPLQALVTERLKPWLHHVIVSATLHVYINQTDRGEVVVGEEIDPYASYSMRSTLRFLENAAAHTLELFPCLARVKVLRQWAGICDMPPDFAPIIGPVDGVAGFLLDVGWGTYGFKAGPAAGFRLAELIATGKTPEVLRPFALSRFADLQPLGEKAAAAVSH